MDVFSTLKAMPNKLLNKDGSITDFKGNIISPADPNLAEVYERSKSIANKFLNSEDEVKTYAEISVEIFEVVDVLPEIGEKNKIYLVPSENGMFDEYFYNPNEKWDKIGEVKIDLSNYPNRQEVADAIAANSTADRQYVDEQIQNIDDEPEIYYTNITVSGTDITSGEGFNFWNSLYDPNNHKPFLVVYKWTNTTDAPYYVWYFNSHNFENNKTYTAQSNRNGIVERQTENTRIQYGSAFVKFNISEGKIISASGNTSTSFDYFLETGVNYTRAYIPTSDGSPATKKYVDDTIKTKVTDVLGGEY